jgi:hypothetical protein
MLRYDHVDGPIELALEFESASARESFLSTNGALLHDMAMTAADPRCDDALLHVALQGSLLWLACIRRLDGKWRGQIIARELERSTDPTSPPLAVKNFLAGPREKQSRKVIHFLKDGEAGLGLPESFPLFLEADLAAAGHERRAVIKVDRSASWFLFIPIEQLAIAQVNRPVAWFVEWVATDKSFQTVLAERVELHRGLQDAECLLRHTVVILNTYEKADFTAEILELTDRAENLLGLLADVPFQIDGGEEELTLRVLRNPGLEELEAALRDPRTRFLLADFHTEEGVWHLGGGKGSFDLNRFEPGSLSHIQLFQVYHCHSMRNPSADCFHGSAVERLLRAGARRVEGSPFIENYVSYLERLVSFVSGHPALNFVMKLQAAVQGLDLARLLEKFSSRSIANN